MRVIVPLAITAALFWGCTPKDSSDDSTADSASTSVEEPDSYTPDPDLIACFESDECKPCFYTETFEQYKLGSLPNKMPWRYDTDTGVMDPILVENDCAVGDRCLAVDMALGADLSDPAYLTMQLGCFIDKENGELKDPWYIQFYTKYLDHEARIGVVFSFSGNFLALGISDGGLKGLNGSGNNLFQINEWYRVELKFDYSEETSAPTINARGYKGDSLVQIDEYEDIATIYREDNYPLYVGVSFELFMASHEVGAFYLDDFAVSDDPSILLAGFEE